MFPVFFRAAVLLLARHSHALFLPLSGVIPSKRKLLLPLEKSLVFI